MLALELPFADFGVVRVAALAVEHFENATVTFGQSPGEAVSEAVVKHIEPMARDIQAGLDVLRSYVNNAN